MLGGRRKQEKRVRSLPLLAQLMIDSVERTRNYSNVIEYDNPASNEKTQKPFSSQYSNRGATPQAVNTIEEKTYGRHR